MRTPGQPLNVRRGVVVGLLVLAVLAPGIAMRSDTPFLTLVETLLIGLAAGLLTEAALSARTADPLATFFSNVMFVVWVALFVGGAALLVERRSRRARA